MSGQQNDIAIFNAAKLRGMPDNMATNMVLQARHETGNYSHRFFTVYNNAFGYMKDARSKWQIKINTPNADNSAPIAAYSSVDNSVNEVVDWIQRRQKEGKFPKDLSGVTVQQYAMYLKNSGYFGATLQSYTNGMVSAISKIPANLSKLAQKSAFMWIVGIALLSYLTYLLINNIK